MRMRFGIVVMVIRLFGSEKKIVHKLLKFEMFDVHVSSPLKLNQLNPPINRFHHQKSISKNFCFCEQMFFLKNSIKIFAQQFTKRSNLDRNLDFNKVQFCFNHVSHSNLESSDEEVEELLNDPEYQHFKDNFFSSSLRHENAYVIQPWIKWGPDKLLNTTSQLMLGD